ncbi:acyl-CoA dehydrogenase family protein [Mycobacterium sp. EPa45]|uniref:acyl-CoA dehydrogenase family protein n=1 Tax=Mycobacterium sp. EPa45 TaxID=1545728 RepID=UPI000641A726|nr:acyl-CoA dehydrogenase family protein [Mycobacterium sp. EPa45]AKK29486.1 acyl-CoA dehydrogenase [Mycobacterium sp. EPa45]
MTPDSEPSLIDVADTAAELAELRSAADDILAHAWSVERTRRLLGQTGGCFDADACKTVVDVGWPDVMVPESRGGGGGGLRELCVLAEAAGAVALPVPLVSMAAAAWCEARCVQDVTLLLDDTQATVTDSGVTGHWPLVPFGAIANRLLVLAYRDGEPLLGVVDASGPGVRCDAERPLDQSPAGRISLDDAPLDVIATGAEAANRHRDARFRAQLATVSELIGIASAANEAAVDYAKVRVTFGRPIGSRQAIKHRLVDQRSAIEVARALVNRAADACELGHPDTEALVSLAVFWAIDSLRRVPEGATQVFGGIAYTWEHDAHVYLRRAATCVAMLGSRAHHREVVTRWLQSR